VIAAAAPPPTRSVARTLRVVARIVAALLMVAAGFGIAATTPERYDSSPGVNFVLARCDVELRYAHRPYVTIDRALVDRARRACDVLRGAPPETAPLHEGIDYVPVGWGARYDAAEDVVQALADAEERDAKQRKLVLVASILAGLFGVLGLGTIGALHALGSLWLVLLAHAGPLGMPALLAIGVAIMVLPCSPWVGTPYAERRPSYAAAALRTVIVGALWSVPTMVAFVHDLDGGISRSEASLTRSFALISFAFVVAPAVVYLFAARSRDELGVAGGIASFLVALLGAAIAALAAYASVVGA